MENQKPDSGDQPPRLRWPKFALVAVVLFFALAIFWMLVAVNKLRQQRDVNAPLPVSVPTR